MSSMMSYVTHALKFFLLTSFFNSILPPFVFCLYIYSIFCFFQENIKLFQLIFFNSLVCLGLQCMCVCMNICIKFYSNQSCTIFFISEKSIMFSPLITLFGLFLYGFSCRKFINYIISINHLLYVIVLSFINVCTLIVYVSHSVFLGFLLASSIFYIALFKMNLH